LLGQTEVWRKRWWASTNEWTNICSVC